MTEQYERAKESARKRARCIELYLEIKDVDQDELAQIKKELEKLAHYYGLTQEFKANGYL